MAALLQIIMFVQQKALDLKVFYPNNHDINMSSILPNYCLLIVLQKKLFMFQLLVKMDWVVNHNLAVYPKTSSSNLSINYILSYWDKKSHGIFIGNAYLFYSCILRLKNMTDMVIRYFFNLKYL